MGKAAIQSQIDTIRGEVTNLNSQISRLEDCKKALTDFSTDIEYELKEYSHIILTYNLAGLPYLNETNNEKAILKSLKQELTTKRDDVVAKLTQKILELDTQKIGLVSSINLLEIQKSVTIEE